MPPTMADWLNDGVIGDGSLAAALSGFGWVQRGPLDAVALDHPALVARALAAFADAGAGLICTPTLGSNRLAAPAEIGAARLEDLNRTAASVCRGVADARPGRVRVAGQIGPSRRFLETGEVEEDELRDVFREQAGWLARGGVELIWLARFNSLPELLLALAASRAAVPLPVVATLVFDSGPDRLETATGDTAATAARRLAEAGAAAVGCDCAAPETALTLVHQLAEHARRPVCVRTNAGAAELADGRLSYSEDGGTFASRAAGLRTAGAALVAGCCGAAVEHIRALSQAWPRAAR
ncbi:MAG: homocysteine S-methyltransferase family protein [Phycisphaerae bacterium]